MTEHRSVMQATWNGVVVAESDDTVVVEGNHYFPLESLRDEFFLPSASRSTCPWKGRAEYLTLTVDGAENRDAAWCYRKPTRLARRIAGRVAFWNGVHVARVGGARRRTVADVLGRLARR